MGIWAEIQVELKKESATKIHRQPTSHDLTILEKELIAILAVIPTKLGGRNHGHVEMIMDGTAYSTMTGGTDFMNRTNPRNLPNYSS